MKLEKFKTKKCGCCGKKCYIAYVNGKKVLSEKHSLVNAYNGWFGKHTCDWESK